MTTTILIIIDLLTGLQTSIVIDQTGGM